VVRFRGTAWPSQLVDAVRAAAPGRESILAAAELDGGGWAAGTREALYIPAGDGLRRLGWEAVERAEWDSDESVLHVWEATPFGTPMRRTDLRMEHPGRFGQLVRERISASILVQRHVPLAGNKGVRIIGRRNPAVHDADVHWSFVLDEGLQPDDPDLLNRAETALAALRTELGI
jgi:hypothetical protein